MISEAKFYGESHETTTAGVADLPMNRRVHVITATSPGDDVRLQDARKLKKGWPLFVLVNASANAYDLRDNADNVIESSIAQTEILFLGLIDNSTQAGTWQVTRRTRKS